MSQLHFYVAEETETYLRNSAEQAGKPLSRYLGDLVKAQVAKQESWPEGYFDSVFGQWEGEPLERAAQGDFETRPELD